MESPPLAPSPSRGGEKPFPPSSVLQICSFRRWQTLSSIGSMAP